MATFSKRLNEALDTRKIKAADLSHITGINEGAISQYRKGVYKAKQASLDKLAKALNVAIPWLMGVDEPPFDVIRPYGYKPLASGTTHNMNPKLANLAHFLESNPDTLAFLEKYIALDDRGKAIVNATLDHEYEFVKGTTQEKHA